MRRALTTKNLYNIKHDVFKLDGVWLDVMGEADTNGAWIVWGAEKNGKTWFTLLLSNMLCDHRKVHYISAEEGTGKAFVDNLKRAKINPNNERIKWMPYEPLSEVRERLKKRQNAPKIVVIDNITVYAKELGRGAFEQLLRDFPDVLFILLAHEEDGKPYTAVAKLVKRLAKLIFYVEGLAATVSGRCPGGLIAIDEERAAIYHGNQLLNNVS